MVHQRQEKKKDSLLQVQSIYEYLVSNQVQDWDCNVIKELSKNPYRDWGELLEYHHLRVIGDRVIGTHFVEVPEDILPYDHQYTGTELVYESFHYCLQECIYDPVLDAYVFPEGHPYNRTWK
jgi:hypothetical protein